VPDLESSTEMTTVPEQYNQLLETIAKKWFNVETLETRGRDGLDFYDVSVGCMKSALDEAFRAGMEIAIRTMVK
jgi:hypothetical protein